MAGWYERVERVTASAQGFWLLLGAVSVWRLLLLISAWDKVPSIDGVIYIEAARVMGRGDLTRALAVYPMPALPSLIALFHLLGLDWPQAGRTVSALFLVLSIIPLYNITRQWFGRAPAFWAGLAFSLPYLVNRMTISIFRGPCHLFFFLVALWAMLRAIRHPSTARTVVALLFSVVPSLFRIEGLMLPVLFPLTILILAFRDRRYRGGPSFLAACWIMLMGGAGVAATLLPGGEDPNRLASVLQALQGLLHLRFLHNYREIYGQLKELEQLSPAAYLDQNFAEIARHYLWLVYLMGAMEYLAAAFYPLYLIPLVIGLKRTKLEREQGLVLITVAVYLTIVYLHLVTHDFTSRRFFLVPATLLYPWVGLGVATILKGFRDKPFVWWMVVILIFSPVTGYARLWDRPGRVCKLAGEWLRRSPCGGLKLMGNDLRIPFSAHIPLHLGGHDPSAPYINYSSWQEDYAQVERLAVATGRDVIILKFSKKAIRRLPKMDHYIPTKRFEAHGKVVQLFARPKVAPLCRDQGEGLPQDRSSRGVP